MSGLTCECGAPFVSHGDMCITTVGTLWDLPPGHEHDTNCMRRDYTCANGHETTIAKVRRCNDEGCDEPGAPACGWTGKRECFCCRTFVDEWPTIEATP